MSTPVSFSDLADGPDSGLRAERSPDKVLNHLDLLRHHEGVAKSLGLHASSPRQQFSVNEKILAAHQLGTWASKDSSHSRRGLPVADDLGGTETLRPGFHRAATPLLDTDEAIARLTENARAHGACFTESDVRTLLGAVYRSAQIEFHPSDVCNEKCRGCTYGHDDPRFKPPPICFPFAELPRLAEFKPRALTIAGGGEPVLYKNKGKGFCELVEELHSLMPECQFGLITNGTLYPRGGWANHFRWIRISVDAATAPAYESFRGRDYFGTVCANLIRLLEESTVPRVGVGFVFCDDNIQEAPAAARFFYDLVNSECPRALPRFSIAYRPLRRDPKDAGRVFPASVTQEQISAAERGFIEMARHEDVARFLRHQTNCEIISCGNAHRPVDFARCDYSMIFRLVRADGEVRPCCMRIAEPEFYLGNVLKDAREKVAMNVLYNAAYLRPGCDGRGCKLCLLNQVIARGLAGEVQPSTSPVVASNPFFG